MPLALENCNRVNVISDRYDRAFSIKAGERVRRQGSSSMHFYIHDPQMPLPKQWSKFICDPGSKANLALFLSNVRTNEVPGRLPEGKTVLVAGGFSDPLTAKCMTHDRSEDVKDLS